jgi:hypothetical protein
LSNRLGYRREQLTDGLGDWFEHLVNRRDDRFEQLADGLQRGTHDRLQKVTDRGHDGLDGMKSRCHNARQDRFDGGCGRLRNVRCERPSDRLEDMDAGCLHGWRRGGDRGHDRRQRVFDGPHQRHGHEGGGCRRDDLRHGLHNLTDGRPKLARRQAYRLARLAGVLNWLAYPV